MTILVTGSRGKVAGHLVRLLHERGLEVRAGSSNPGELSLPEGVATVALSLDDPDGFAEALRGVSSVFLYCEPSHVDAFIEQAEAAGAGHVVLMSADAVLFYDPAVNAISALHQPVEEALRASTIPATVLNCGALASNVLPWAYSLRARGAVLLPYPDSHADPVDERDIAECAARLLTEPGPWEPSYHLSGPESFSFAEQVAIIEGIVGRTIPIERITPEQWRAAKPAFIPDPVADALLEIWAASAGPAKITDHVAKLTGRPARTFAAWVTENADAFRG